MKKLIAGLLFILPTLAGATVQTVSTAGSVTISTTGWRSAGQVFRLRIDKGESVSYSYGGTSTATYHLQVSDNGTTWTSLINVTSNGLVSTVASTRDVVDHAQFFRFFVSSYTAGSINFTLDDRDDVVSEIKNHKGKVIHEVNDDSVVIYGTQTVSGNQTVSGYQTIGTGLVFPDGSIQITSATVAATAFTTWASYTPTITGMGTVSNVAFRWRQAGTDTIEIEGYFTAGTTTGTEARISLPSGFTSASNYPTTFLIGWGGYGVNTASYVGYLIEASKTYFCFAYPGGTGGTLAKQQGSDLTSSANYSVKVALRASN